MSDETVLVVPCYNEAARFDRAAFDEFLAQSTGVSLLLVDDGSTDDTARVLEQLRAAHPRRVTVLGLGENVGKAEAVRRGVKLALRRSPALVGYWDADLATPLETALDFREVLLERPELVLVMGSRVALLGRQIRRKWTRHLTGRAFATAASLALNLVVYDTQCGAKLFRVTDATAEIFERPFQTRWIFDVEILARMIAGVAAAGERAVEEVVYEFPLLKWEDVAGSRLKWSDFLVAGMDLAGIRLRYGSRFRVRSTLRPLTVAQPVDLREAA